TRFPCRDWAGTGVIRAIFMESQPSLFPGAGAKPGIDIIAGWWEKIPVGVVRQARARGPGPTFEHFAIAKPGGRILAVGIVHEIAWERIEGRLRPFPDIACHLAAAKGAIASREGSNVDTPQEARVQIGTRRRRRLITPGIAALAPGNTLPVRRRLGTGSEFPLGFSGQPPASPLTV